MAWVRLDDLMPEHPKVLKAGPLAAWLHVCALAYCNRHLTDGRIPAGKVGALADLDEFGTTCRDQADRLVKAGMWGRTADGFVIHDYHDFQPSREEVEERRAKRSAAGRKGAEARWGAERDGKSHGNRMAKRCDPDAPYPDPSSTSEANASDTESPEAPVLSLVTAVSSTETVGQQNARGLCELLASLIVENGSRPPTITKRWLDAARLLVDADGRTPEQVEACIRWCQRDEFWRTVVLSMPKLRERYDQLRLAAQRGRQAGLADVVEALDRIGGAA